MKKTIAEFSIILFLYMFITFVFSLVFGALSFGQGTSVGYPTIYYCILVDGEPQGGFTHTVAIVFNFLIVTGILLAYKFIITRNKAYFAN